MSSDWPWAQGGSGLRRLPRVFLRAGHSIGVCEDHVRAFASWWRERVQQIQCFYAWSAGRPIDLARAVLSTSRWFGVGAGQGIILRLEAPDRDIKMFIHGGDCVVFGHDVGLQLFITQLHEHHECK